MSWTNCFMRNLNKYLLFLVFVTMLSCQPNPYKQGQTLYDFHCANCHMNDGKGLEKLIPDLGKSEIFHEQPQSLICLIRKGKPLNPATGQQMPANTSLNAVEMTNLINYLRSVYKPESAAVQVNDVDKWLSGCQ